jgi:uncharacterized membrane protein YedE/YeeE
MIKRIGGWTLFIVSLFIAWRLAGVLMDFALLGISIVMLVVCWYRPYKAKNNTAQKSPVVWGSVECYEKTGSDDTVHYL